MTRASRVPLPALAVALLLCTAARAASLSSPQPTDEVVPGPGSKREIGLALAKGNNQSLAIFLTRYTQLGDELHAVRVDSAGQILDPSPKVVVPALGYPVSGDVEFDGQNYLVVWDGRVTVGTEVYGARV